MQRLDATGRRRPHDVVNANLYEQFRARFPADPARPVVETASGALWSYADLERETGRLAACLLDLGSRKGDRVAVQIEKSPRALFLYLACLRAGLVYLPLNPAYPEPELEYFLGDAEPALLVCRPQSQPGLEALASRHRVRAVLNLDAAGAGTLAEAAAAFAPFEGSIACDPEDPAALLYTSGTTGRPKGAVLSHRNLASNAEVLQRAWGFGADDLLLHALPLFHTHGLFVACHCVLQGGASMLLLPRFDLDEVLRLLPRASVFMGVPTFYVRLLQHPGLDAAACRNLRLAISGSAPLLPQTFEAFRERTGHTILERYGMTECGMVTSNPLEGARKAGTVGTPLPGVALRVVDGNGEELPPGATGAVEFRGPNVFRGYWRMPDRRAQDFSADGYFRSGDLGVIDAGGYLTLVGREKDLIISGGLNVYPKEVETLLDRIEGVAESAVIGMPDEDLGERVTAVVVPAGPAGALDPPAIIASLRTGLAGYKVPKALYLVDELPRNAMGKVRKNRLRERVQQLSGGSNSRAVRPRRPAGPEGAHGGGLRAPNRARQASAWCRSAASAAT